MKTVSVIVPVYNAEGFLPYLFDCFEHCEFAPGDEILLIDNGSTDSSHQMCEEQMKKYPELYRALSYTEKADSYATRNYGVSLAQGEIFAFTDSDCKPTPQWLYEIKTTLTEGEVLAGQVTLEILNNGIWECFDSVTHLSQSEIHIQNHCVATANMSVHASDFFKVGKFEERFAGGDFEWSKRAFQSGLNIRFDPLALIIHPSRKTFEEILTRERRGAYGAGNHQRLNGGAAFPLLARYFLKIFKIDTNISLTKKLKAMGLSRRDLITFNRYFMKIRRAQLLSAWNGYQGLDARSIGVK